MDRKEFFEFYEQLLKAQLSVVRQFSGQGGERRKVTGKSRSQVGIAEDILQAAEHPLHVTEIIKRAKEEFDIKKILVISGVGAREYYRKLGYSNNGPYVSKSLY